MGDVVDQGVVMLISYSTVVILSSNAKQGTFAHVPPCGGYAQAVTSHWGTCACNTSQDHPEELRNQLEALLKQEGIEYSYSTTSKFANFVNKTLL